MLFIKYFSSGLWLLLAVSDLSSANVRLCGPSLTQFLDIVCVEGFNQKNLKAKKSVPMIDYEDNGVDNDIQPSSALSSLFLDKMYANQNNLMAKTRRRRHDGVADECCLKPCTMPELLSYCL